MRLNKKSSSGIDFKEADQAAKNSLPEWTGQKASTNNSSFHWPTRWSNPKKQKTKKKQHELRGVRENPRRLRRRKRRKPEAPVPAGPPGCPPATHCLRRRTPAGGACAAPSAAKGRRLEDPGLCQTGTQWRPVKKKP